MNRIVKLIILICCLNSQLTAQKVGYNFGRHLQLIETVQAGDWYSFDKFNFDLYKFYFIEYPIFHDKVNIHINHAIYDGWTGFSFNDNADAIGFGGHGSSRIELLRYGIGVNYEIFNVGNVLKVVPFAKLEFERNKSRSKKRIQAVNSPDINDSSIFSDWLVTVETFPGTQWVPHLGVRFDLRVIWRIYAHLEYGWSFGSRPYQRLYFDNYIDDVEQPRGEWLSNGTLKIKTFGFSIKFWGPPEKIEKKIEIF